jgi:hypothetical protein
VIARTALLLAISSAAAATARADTETPVAAPASKKELRLAEKAKARELAGKPAERTRLERELKKRVGKKAPAVINIYNTWTHEYVAIDAPPANARPKKKKKDAPPPPSPLPPEAVNHFLRCHFTNHQIKMDERLFGVLVAAADHFKVARVDIVSGFRAPKYNLMLRKKGHRVARNSQHTFGNAVDFRLPGVPTARLRDWARRLRMGGVGYYEGDGFVHVDTGPIRYWVE